MTTLSKVTLHLDMTDGTGAPLTQGTATLVPSEVLTDATDQVLITQQPVPVQITSSDPVVELVATDNTAITQTGWAWTVTFTAMPSPPPAMTFALPYSGGAVQYLSQVTEVEPVTQYAAYLQIPSGTAVSGDVPVATGTGTATAWGAASGGFTTAGAGLAASGTTVSLSVPVSVADGGTGATSAGTALTSLGAASSTALTAETSRAETAEGLLAPKASPALTGTPAAPTAAALDNSTRLATTAYADLATGVEKTRALAAEALLAPLASPALTGNPVAPTQTALTSNTRIATTAYTDAAVAVETSRAGTAEALKAPLASPALTGSPTAPTQTTGDSSTKIATDAFVATAVATETARAETAEAGLVPLSSLPLSAANGGTGVAGSSVFNVKAYGAAGNTQFLSGGAMTASSATLTAASGTPFTSGDVGKRAIVYGAGAAGVHLTALISAFVSSAQVTLAASASTTVSGAIVTWGTDDTAAVQAAVTASGETGNVYLPAGIYTMSGGFGALEGGRVYGDGAGNCGANQAFAAATTGVTYGSAIVMAPANTTSLVGSTSPGMHEFDHLNVIWTAPGGKIFAAEGNGNPVIRDSRFEVNDPSGLGQVTASFVQSPFGTWERCTFVQTSSTRQLPLYQSVSASSGAEANVSFNSCQWVNFGFDNNQPVTDFEYQGSSGGGDNYTMQVAFRDNTFARCWGGASKMLGVANPLFENCGFWDLADTGHPTTGNSILYFGAYSGAAPCRGVRITGCFKNRSWADGTSMWDVCCESTTQGVRIEGWSTKPDSNTSGANLQLNFSGCNDVTLIGNQSPSGNNPGTTYVTNPPASGFTVTSGTVSFTTPLGFASGGTSAATQQGALNALAGGVTSGSYLRGNGTVVALGPIAAADVPVLNQNTAGTAAGLSSVLAVGSGGTGTATGAPQNDVFAGPASGGAGAPSFRTLVAADVPTLNQNTTGTAAGLSAALAITSGGTGQVTAAAGLAALGGLVLQSTTGLTGYPLVNGTGNILTWTAPGDAAIHRVWLTLIMRVTSATTGGNLNITFTDPSNTSVTQTLLAATQSTGIHGTTTQGYATVPVYPGTTYTLSQASAMTAGAATAWAEIWAR